jgi:hypothetical protein
VGVSNAIAVADAFVRGPALARRWSETTFATATRWISAFRVRIPITSHGGLTPPALTLHSERLSAKKRFLRCTIAHSSQERWASARRDSVNRTLCRRNHALTMRRTIQRLAVCDWQDDCRIKSGGRQPAVGVHLVKRSAWCAANHVQARFSNHGGLTPPALVAVRTFAICAVAKKRFLRCTNAHSTRAAGVSPPWYDADAGKAAVSHKRRIVRRAIRSESSAARHQGGLYPSPMQAQRGCTTSGCAIDRLASSPERRTCSAG